MEQLLLSFENINFEPGVLVTKELFETTFNNKHTNFKFFDGKKEYNLTLGVSNNQGVIKVSMYSNKKTHKYNLYKKNDLFFFTKFSKNGISSIYGYIIPKKNKSMEVDKKRKLNVLDLDFTKLNL
jgi:hypothetical protein